MQLIGLDFETTGLNPEKDLIIEVGAVVWDTDLHAPIVIDNFLTNWGVAITPEVTKVNGISDNMVVTYGISPETAFHRLKEILNRSDYVVAHNGNLFDKVFLEKWFLEAETDSFQPQHTWIDTIHDIEYPGGIASNKLKYLAAEHGFLNPFAHRAVFDVLTMMTILDKYDLGPILESAAQPMILVQAIVEYRDKDKAKENKFYWTPEKKAWLRSMKKRRYEKAVFPFKTRIVG